MLHGAKARGFLSAAYMAFPSERTVSYNGERGVRLGFSTVLIGLGNYLQGSDGAH